jgi:hypothetical protein
MAKFVRQQEDRDPELRPELKSVLTGINGTRYEYILLHESAEEQHLTFGW